MEIKKTKSKKENKSIKKAKRVGKNFNKTTIKEKKTKIKNLTHKLLAFTLSYLILLGRKKGGTRQSLKRWAEGFCLASGDRHALGGRDCFRTEKRELRRAQMPDVKENRCVDGGRSSAER
jgi:hypothetical protein